MMLDIDLDSMSNGDCGMEAMVYPCAGSLSQASGMLATGVLGPKQGSACIGKLRRHLKSAEFVRTRRFSLLSLVKRHSQHLLDLPARATFC